MEIHRPLAAATFAITVAYVLGLALGAAAETQRYSVNLSEISALNGPGPPAMRDHDVTLRRTIRDPDLAANVSVELEFRPELAPGMALVAALRGGTVPFETLYDPLLEQVATYPFLDIDDGRRLYATGPSVAPQALASLDLSGLVVVTNTELEAPGLLPDAARSWGAATASPQPPEIPHVAWPTAFTGELNLLVYAPSGAAPMVVTVLDANRIPGNDSLDVRILDLQGKVLRAVEIPDTSEENRTTAATEVDWPAAGWMRVTSSGLGGSDLALSGLVLPGPALARGRLDLTAPAAGLTPTLAGYLYSPGGNASFAVRSNRVPATVTLTPVEGGQARTIGIATRDLAVNVTLDPGVYRFDSTAAHVRFIHAGSLWWAGGRDLPALGGVDDKTGVRWTVPLVGNHDFWTTSAGGLLTVELAKQDRNRNGRADNLTVSLRTASGETLAIAEVPDDNRTSSNGVRGPLQELAIEAEVPAGAYRIVLEGSGDYLLLSVATSGTHLVSEHLRVADPLDCCPVPVPVSRPTVLWYGSLGPGSLQPSADNRTLARLAGLPPFNDRADAGVGADHARGARLRIDVPPGDVALSGPGYFALSADTFFLPRPFEVIPLGPDLAQLAARADFLLVDFAAYEPRGAAPADGYYRWSSRQSAALLDLADGEVKIDLLIEGYPKDGNATAALRSVSVQVQPAPAWERHSALRWTRWLT
jgi:hypothetical protein